MGLGNRPDPCIRDCDSVGITPKVFDRIAKTVEGLFDIRTPVLLIKQFPERLPFIGIAHFFAGRRKGELP